MPDIHFDPSKPRQINESMITDPTLPPIIAFDILQVLGLILISASLCTVWFSSRVQRSTAWFSCTFSWGLTCIGYLLIIRHQTGPFPGSILCLCQAMLIYAFPALNALAFTTLTLEIFLSISYYRSISRSAMVALYFLPYGVFAGILITVFILGRLNPTAVLRTPFGMFCCMSIRVPSYLSWAIVICCMATSIIFGVYIIFQYRRHRNASIMLLTRNRISFGLVLRVGIIGALLIVSIALGVANMLVRNDKSFTMGVYLTFAAYPMVVGIIYISQEDILRVWMFWREPPQALSGTSREPEIIEIPKVKNEPQSDESGCRSTSQDHDI